MSILDQMSQDAQQQEEEQIESITEKQKTELHEKALEVLETEKRIKETQTLLKELSAKRNRLVFNEIPAILDEWNQEGVTYADVQIMLKFDLFGSFPKISEDGDTAKVDNAIEELSRFEGGKDIIKNAMNVEFPKGKFDEVDKIALELIERGFNPIVTNTVHHATLKSFVKKRIENTDINPTLVGLFARNVANVKARKK